MRGCSASALLLTLCLYSVPAAAQDEASRPVVDRVILKKKKKVEAAPVVDRVILKKKEKNDAPAPLPPESEILEEVPMPEVYTNTSPVGTTLNLAYSSGPLDRVHLGGGYWFSDCFGLAVQSGFTSARERKTIATVAGPRAVQTVEYTAAPELSLLWAPVAREKLRVYLESGGGVLLQKAERQDLALNYHAHAGPGIQWLLIPQFSVQLGERFGLLFLRGSDEAHFALSTQLTASYWFE